MDKAIIANSDYDTSTFKYTVPENHAGIYMFSLQTNWFTAGDFDNNQIALYKNGLKIGQHQARQEHYENQNLVTIENVNVGDYFQMYVSQESGASINLRAAQGKNMTEILSKIKQRMDVLQHWMESNYHLRKPDVVTEHIETITKFWSVLNDEDKDYIDGARYAIDEKMEWKLNDKDN